MPPPADPFVTYLERLRDREDLGALAALRRGLGKAPWEAPETFPYIVPWLPANASRWREHCYFLVGALFAWHRRSDQPGERRRNFGSSFAKLVTQRTEDSLERRFSALLVSNQDELPDRLRSAVGLLRGQDVPVDWTQLLHDLRWWGTANRVVERAWARAFWARGPREGSES